MTTREEQDVRWWPTEAGLAAIADEPPVGAVEWAEENYPGGYAMNGAGQPIRRPVYDDPESAHLYPAGGQR